MHRRQERQAFGIDLGLSVGPPRRCRPWGLFKHLSDYALQFRDLLAGCGAKTITDCAPKLSRYPLLLARALAATAQRFKKVDHASCLQIGRIIDAKEAAQYLIRGPPKDIVRISANPNASGRSPGE